MPSVAMSVHQQFQPFSSAVDVSFWSALAKAKLDVYHLDASAKPIVAAFQTSGHVQVPSQLCLGSYSLDASLSSHPRSMDGAAFGSLHNANTMEDFRRTDAKALLQQVRAEMWAQLKRHIQDAEQQQTQTQAVGSAGAASSLTRILSRFLLLSYADLKSHRYAYWFCFPALVVEGLTMRPADQAEARGVADFMGAPACVQLLRGYGAFVRSHPLAEAGGPGENYFAVEQRTAADGTVVVAVLPIESFGVLHRAAAANAVSASTGGRGTSLRVFLGFVDPCPLDAHPGWPARSLLAYVWLRWGISGRVDLLAFRDGDAARSLVHDSSSGADGGGDGGDSGSQSVNVAQLRSMVFPVSLDPSPDLDRASLLRSADGEGPKVVGWERGSDGKSTPRLVDLGALMDPVRLAESSADLNLKLMRWRALPALDLPKLAQTRCLLLGAGTLGCNVARALLAWGFRRITLVDSGYVSYSNPVRQSLFESADCQGGPAGRGRPKAEAAAAALRRIFPSVESEGIQLSIPMPGHAVPPSEDSSVRAAIAQMESLVARSDLVFLLTDSRESRWLPTLLCARQGKVCINAALGFDTYVVMRHGDNYHKHKQQQQQQQQQEESSAAAASSSSSSSVASSVSSLLDPSDLGCYFCNDVVAPADSLSDRTLDQQCFCEETRLHTSRGFLFLEEIEALSEGEREGLLYSCYDVAKQTLVWSRTTLLPRPSGTHQLYELTQKEADGESHGEGAGEPRSDHLSVRVTGEHTLFVQTAPKGGKFVEEFARITVDELRAREDAATASGSGGLSLRFLSCTPASASSDPDGHAAASLRVEGHLDMDASFVKRVEGYTGRVWCVTADHPDHLVVAQRAWKDTQQGGAVIAASRPVIIGQCTVTRPGLAFISAALAVELAVSLLHHPMGARAPADVDSSSAHSRHSTAAGGGAGDEGSPLGLVPHQLRGFLGRFNQTLVQGQAFSKCTACSGAILSQYESDGAEFVMRALNGPPQFLEDVSGLTQLKADAEKAIEDMEMRAESDSEGDDF